MATATTNPHAIRVPRDIRRRVESAIEDEFGETLLAEVCWHDPRETRGATRAVACFAVGGRLHQIANGFLSVSALDRWIKTITFDDLLVQPLNGTYHAVYREGRDG